MNKKIGQLIKVWLLGLSRLKKNLIVCFIDYLILIVAFLTSLSIRNNEIYFPTDQTFTLIILAPFLALPIFFFFGLYKTLFRYAGYINILWIISAVSIYTISWFFVVLLIGMDQKPYDFLIINWLVSSFLIALVRYFARWFLFIQDETITNVVIYGAGSAGMQVRNAFWHSNEIKVIAFIDDDQGLQGKYIDGLRVYSIQEIKKLKHKSNINEVILAIPSLSKHGVQEKIKQLTEMALSIRVLPSLHDIAKGRISISDLRKVNIEDLLKREVRKPNHELMKKNIKNKSVMVTGAAGSIGSELCRQILQHNPRKLILLDISEYGLYKIENELAPKIGTIDLLTKIGDVRNFDDMDGIMSDENVETIYHAAAYKQVPLVEKNILAGVDANIFGTVSCAKAAVKNNIESFVFISTDKAVRPTNVMGATKRFAELMLDLISSKAESEGRRTQISMVRFGNVLGSSGSVVPLFRAQIAKGGPVTVTDPHIIRYFMTITEAAQLVIQAGAMGNNRGLYLLDMGQPVEISTLARDMIKLSGKTIKDNDNPDGDIEIVYTGLRPGEKLFEELLIDKSSLPTIHEKIMQADEKTPNHSVTEEQFSKIRESRKNRDTSSIIEILKDSVDGYTKSDYLD